MNVSVNGEVSLTCTAVNADSILWQVNRSDYLDHISGLETVPSIEQEESQLIYTLKFTVTDSVEIGLLNSSNITCRGYSLFPEGYLVLSNHSSPAQLLIQG